MLTQGHLIGILRYVDCIFHTIYTQHVYLSDVLSTNVIVKAADLLSMGKSFQLMPINCMKKENITGKHCILILHIYFQCNSLFLIQIYLQYINSKQHFPFIMQFSLNCFPHRVPYMIGCNSHEGAMFTIPLLMLLDIKVKVCIFYVMHVREI